MNEQQFRALVKEMRTAQKDYFKNKLRSDLIKSKDLERRVDAELSAGPEKPAQEEQMGLFQEGDNNV